MQILLANSLAIVCAISAAAIAISGADGWGWFLFVALCTTYSNRKS